MENPEIPGYRIERELGRGGMATVYLAVQEALDRQVALKVMAGALGADGEFGERFLREARTVARLSHPHIVAVHDVGSVGDDHYMAMEYIGGGDLAARMKQQLDRPQAMAIVRQIALALQHAHTRGFVHRDIKPENILFREDGDAVLSDFGIAKALSSSTQLTALGMSVGTPTYISPEQAQGLSGIDGRADLYSLGVVLYQLLAGRVPFEAENSMGLAFRHVTEPPPPLPAEVAKYQRLIDGLLAKNPDERFASAGELVAAIDALEAGRQPDYPRVQDVDVAETVEPPQAPDWFGNIQRNLDRILREQPGLAWGVGGAMLAALIALGVWGLTGLGPQNAPQGVGGGDRSLHEPLQAVKLPATGRQDNGSLSATPLRPEPRLPGGQAKPALSAQTSSPADESKAASPAAFAPANVTTAVKSEVSTPAVSQPGSADGVGRDSALKSRERTLLQQAKSNAKTLPALAKLYRGKLQRSPNDAWAEKGLDKVKQIYVADLQAAMAAGDSDRVAHLLAGVTQTLPQRSSSPDLTPARQWLAKQKQIDRLLARADDYLDKNALTSPRGANAWETYQKVLDADPGNARAAKGEQRIAARYADLSARALHKGDFSRAQQLVQRGVRVSSDQPRLLALQKEIAGARQQAATDLLSQAQKLQASGALILPAGANAYDRYRQALAVDPQNAAAEQALATIHKQVSSRIEALEQKNDVGRLKPLVSAACSAFPHDAVFSAIEKRLQTTAQSPAQQVATSSRPEISRVIVSSSAIDTMKQPQQSALAQTDSLYFGIRYSHFSQSANVLKTILYDASHAIQITEVPVVLDGGQGVKFFSIDRPVNGFPTGIYNYDVLFKGRKLASGRFRVGKGSPD